MECSTEDTRLKSRSTVATIKAGYQLYFSHFSTLMRISWLEAVVYALFCTILGLLAIVYYPRLIFHMAFLEETSTLPQTMVTLMLVTIAALVVTVLLGGVAELVFYSRGLYMLRQHNDTDCILTPARWITFDKKSAWRMVKGALFSLALLLPFGLLIGALQYWIVAPALHEPLAHAGTLTIVAIGTFVISLFYLPLTHVQTDYLLLDKGNFWHILHTTYGEALRHFGYIFAVTLVTIIIISAASAFLLLPAEILALANYQANAGQLLGDALNMPGYTVVIAAVVFFISGIVMAYLRISALFVYYYMNGSIHTQEQERKQVKL